MIAPTFEGEGWQVVHADCVDALDAMPEASIDAYVTDPPYGLEFMGSDWDRFAPRDRANASVWDGRRQGSDGWEADAAARSGAGGGGPTYGRMTKRGQFRRCSTCGRREFSGTPCGCESPSWQYETAAGAPSPMLAFQAWATEWASAALRAAKPGAWLVAFGGTRTVHRLASGIEDAGWEIRDLGLWLYRTGFPKSRDTLKPAWEPWVVARKTPEGSARANVERNGLGMLNIDEARVGFADVADERETKDKNRHGDFGSAPRENRIYGEDKRAVGDLGNYDPEGRWPPNVVTADEHYPWRHFRSSVGVELLAESPKASQEERPQLGELFHPTVKPLAVMRHLVRLVVPPGGFIVDPFVGSGTTLEAAVIEGRTALGIESHRPYLDLVRERMTKPIAQAFPW